MNQTLQELTVALIKPDVACFPAKVAAIRTAIANHNLTIIRSRRLHMSEEHAKEFYAEHKGRFFYPRLVTFISSGELVAMVLRGHGAITSWRNLMGPTKVYRTIGTHPHSLRGLYGLSDTRNSTHGSDSVQSVIRELSIFFPDESYEELLLAPALETPT